MPRREGAGAVRGPFRRLGALAPPIDVDGPRVRLGIVWAAVSTLAVGAGPVPAAVVFGAVALGAAGQAARSWNRRARKPFRPVAIAGAVLVAAAAAAGPVGVAIAAGVVGGAAVVAPRVVPAKRPPDATLTAAIALLVGAGAAAPVVVRGELGFTPAVVLLTSVHVFDASAFIVGSAGRRWEGVVAGAAAVGALGLLVAAVFVPPFRSVSPWVLVAITVVLAPLGGVVASFVLAKPTAPAPALRRLDAFLLAAPAWALAARLLLD